jgi:hypothetical protein
MPVFEIRRRHWIATPLVLLFVSLGWAKATDLNPAAIAYKLPEQIKWNDDPIGAKMAVVQGDPSKPGLYVVLVKWAPHHKVVTHRPSPGGAQEQNHRCSHSG